MICPECQLTARVKDTRQATTYRWRKYVCPNGHRFTTEEVVRTLKSPQHTPVEIIRGEHQ